MEQNPNKVKGILKVGDKVSWRGTWGKDAPQEVIVDAIEANCNGTKRVRLLRVSSGMKLHVRM